MSYLLRVATLNLRHDADRWEERLPLIVAELAQERPHVIGFQELALRVDQAGPLLARLNEACRAAGEPTVYDIRVQPKTGAEGLREGLAIAARLPIVDYGWLDLAGGSRVAQRVRLGLPGGIAVDFYNTHLHHEQAADELRRAQAARLLGWAQEQSAGVLSIVVGDMNALPDSPAIRLYKQSFASVYELAHGEEPEFTFPTPMVVRDSDCRATIDYILVLWPTGGVKIVSAWRAFERPAEGDPTLYPSDHYGLMAEIALL